MDFNPNFDKEEEKNNKQEIVNINTTPTYNIDDSDNDNKKDILSMTNLLAFTQSHIEGDMECKKEIDETTMILSMSKEKMSLKEMIDYLKVKIKEREFHADCIFKAYQYILKTEVAKELLAGSATEEKIIDIDKNNKVKKLVKILKDAQTFKD